MEPNLESVYQLFRRHERPFALGPWSKLRKGDLAAAHADHRLHVVGALEAPLACAIAKNPPLRDLNIADFTRSERLLLPKGVPIIERIAYTDPEYAAALLYTLKEGHSSIAFWTWTEHLSDAQLRAVVGKGMQVHKIDAFSSMRILSTIGSLEGFAYVPLPPSEESSLGQMRGWPEQDVNPLLAALNQVEPTFTNHYSTYNKGKSWSAISFRTFGGKTECIHKPAEMAKRWQLEHPEEMNFKLDWTPLLKQLPEVMGLLNFFRLYGVEGNQFHRVRIMRLAPAGGELERHADITDPDCGTADGKVMRLHLPLVTNPGVLFSSWNLSGQPHVEHFPVGKWFYLDTRKAHTAINNGMEDRLHLVVDLPSNEALRNALP